MLSACSPADIGTAGTAAIAAGLVANPLTLWSEYTLFSTGAGLPPGPGGLLGAAEVRRTRVIAARSKQRTYALHCKGGLTRQPQAP